MSSCGYCGSGGEGGQGLLRCTRCKQAYYCNQEHQKAHWKQHKLQCKVQDEGGDHDKRRKLQQQQQQQQQASTSSEQYLGPEERDLEKMKKLEISQLRGEFLPEVVGWLEGYLAGRVYLQDLIGHLGGFGGFFALFLNDNPPNCFRPAVDKIFESEESVVRFTTTEDVLPLLKLGLVHPSAEVRAHALTGFSLWLRTVAGRKFLTHGPFYSEIFELIMDSEVTVSANSSKILVELTKQLPGAEGAISKFFSHAAKIFANPKTDLMRTLRLLSAAVDSAVGIAQTDAERATKLLSESHALERAAAAIAAAQGDVLLQLNLVQLVARLVALPGAMAALLDLDLLPKLLASHQHLVSEESPFLTNFDAGVLELVGKMGEEPHGVGLLSKGPVGREVGTLLANSLRSADETLSLVAVNTVASLASSKAGLLFLQKQTSAGDSGDTSSSAAPIGGGKKNKQSKSSKKGSKKPTNSTDDESKQEQAESVLENVLAVLPGLARETASTGSSRAMVCAIMHAVAKALEHVYVGDAEVTNIQRALYSQTFLTRKKSQDSESNTIASTEQLLSLASEPIEEVKLAVLELWTSLSGHVWGQVALVNSGGVLEWLTDRSGTSVASKEGAERKYEVVRRLVAPLSAQEIDANPLFKTLHKFLQQGVFTGPEAPSREGYVPQVKGPKPVAP